jgi:hypothetical protein
VVEVSTAADLVEVSTEEAAASTAEVSGASTAVGVDLAGAVVGVVGSAGAVAGVTQAGDAAGVGVIPFGAGGLALVGVGAGVPIGERTPMRMAIPIIRTTQITHTMGRTLMRQRTRTGTTVATEIRVTIRSGKIRAIARRRDRLT